MAPSPVEIDGHLVGDGCPPYIIAEIGSNHNGDMDLCRQLIDAAKSSGAHAVKFQSWSKSSLICKAEYATNTEYTDTHRHFGSLEEMVERYQLTPKQHRTIQAYCQEVGITFLSSAFSPEEVDLLDELKVPAIKIASMDVNHLPLLRYLAQKPRPVILSTGMATLGEIERAIEILSPTCPVILLHCISIYPPSDDAIHLNNIPMLRAAFDVVGVGFSDHTQGTAVSLGAIALGASVIEKHFTLDKTLPGWDHWISADPPEMQTLCEMGHRVYLALGRSQRIVSTAELEKRKAFRRCIVARRDLPSGQILNWTDLDFKRPGNGIDPDQAEWVVGRTLITPLEADQSLRWEQLGVQSV